jgi:hypothetical protein
MPLALAFFYDCLIGWPKIFSHSSVEEFEAGAALEACSLTQNQFLVLWVIVSFNLVTFLHRKSLSNGSHQVKTNIKLSSCTD